MMQFVFNVPNWFGYGIFVLCGIEILHILLKFYLLWLRRQITKEVKRVQQA